MNTRFSIVLSFTWAMSFSPIASADISLPPIFSEHMVLQKGEAVLIWGKAAPEEEVLVSVAGKSARTRASAGGKWRVNLDLSQVGSGPFQMIAKGNNQIIIDDVLIGEVWLASGQSNMATPLSEATGSSREISDSANSQLRQFLVAPAATPEPTEEYQGRWTVASPETSSRFSAVAYYFGKMLQKELKVPVGILNSSVGGTFCESWMSPQALAGADLLDLQKRVAERAASYPAKLQKYAADFSVWEKQFGRDDRPKAEPGTFAAPDASISDWKTIKLPASFASSGLPDAGVVWLRKEVDIPPRAAGRPIRFDCGTVRDFTTVYWNGTKVAETTPATLPPGAGGKFSYIIPASETKAGKATIAVRVYTPRGNAGLDVSPTGFNFRLTCDGLIAFLAGDWLAKAEYELPKLEAAASETIPSEPAMPMQARNIPGYLYNAMIHPVVPYGLRGFIWYQGETNANFAHQYHQIFPALIRDWRALWNNPDLPFYFCSLAAFGPIARQPGDSAWAELREAQHVTTRLPATGEAILIDIGEEKDIHPRNKKDAGERLATVALRGTYGKSIPAAGPTYQGMQKEGDKIRLQFSNIDGGLSAHPIPSEYQPRSIDPEKLPLIRNSPKSQLEGFSICGVDRQWRWAEAKIDGAEIVVWSPQVSDPVAVRYAWADNPIVNLYNGAGFPAVPFRTDDFAPITTAKRED